MSYLSMNEFQAALIKSQGQNRLSCARQMRAQAIVVKARWRSARLS